MYARRRRRFIPPKDTASQCDLWGCLSAGYLMCWWLSLHWPGCFDRHYTKLQQEENRLFCIAVVVLGRLMVVLRNLTWVNVVVILAWLTIGGCCCCCGCTLKNICGPRLLNSDPNSLAKCSAGRVCLWGGETWEKNKSKSGQWLWRMGEERWRNG